MDPHWIGPAEWTTDADPVCESPVAFRAGALAAPARAKRAVLRVAASGRYAVWVNGVAAHRGPARAFPDEPILDEVDVTRLVRPGGPVAVAMLLTPPTGVVAYSVATRMGAFVELTIEGADGVAARVVSGPGWRAREAGWISSRGFVASLPTGPQEHFDGAHEPENWQVAPPEDGWSDARVLGPAGTPPWAAGPVARPIPLLVETPLTPAIAWAGRDDRVPAPAGGNVAAAFNARSVVRAADDDAGANVVTYDLGRTRLVQPGLRFDEVAGDVVVEVFYDIALGDRPTAMPGFGSAREGFADTVRPRPGGPSAWAGLQARGCRFVTVRVAGTGAARVTPDVCAIDYPLPPERPLVIDAARRDAGAATNDAVGTGTDASGRGNAGDALLHAIWRVSAATIRSSTNDAIVDTCSRENVLWTLDACVTGRAAFHTFGETKMWARCLRLIAAGVDARGVPKAVVPAGDSFMVLPDQTMAWARSCAEYVALTGDASVARDVAPAVARFLGWCERGVTADDLYAPPGYAWHYVDWAAIDRRAYALPVNALLLLAARAGAALARAAGDASLAGVARRIDARLAPALPRFFDPAAGCFAGHVPPTVDVGVENRFGWHAEPLAHNAHGNALALMAGVGTAAQRAAAAAVLARWLSDPADPHNHYGPGWADIILGAAADAGHRDAALASLRHHYGRVLAAGAPTWPENFSPAPHNTAHGWGAAANTFLATHVATRA